MASETIDEAVDDVEESKEEDSQSLENVPSDQEAAATMMIDSSTDA